MWSGADASYLAAITAAGRKYTWHGTLTDANGSTYNFDAEDIVKGSGQISKMVSSDTSLDIGTVYTSELTIRLYLAVNRYVLFGGTIDLYCDMDVNGATYSVPMGEYIIASCTQEMACISITAYDAMTKLDSVNVVQDLGASTPYAWITYFLSRAGLTLGTAQATIEAMPNGTELLTFTNCNTELAAMPCRDALAYMCMILCANAYVGRDGKVYIQQYSMTADDDIAANERFSSSFSDFTTNYTSVTLGIHATGTTEYYAQPTDDGLNYDLGANPWMQAGSAAARETMCRAILADLNAVSYEPYTVSIPIRPELDPMDVLTFSGNQASTDKGAVTSVVYKLGGAMTIKCSGENPRLAGAKSKTQKSLEALSSTVAKEINQMSVVQNSSSVTCGENTETSILTYNFEVTQEENTTMADVSVVMTSSASETEVGDVYTLSDIVAHLSFYVDGSEVNVYAPEFIVDEGKDTMTFNFSLSGLSVGAHEFDIRLTVDGGSGSIAVGDVHEMLWGYGITFEVYVKSIEIVSLPTKTTFASGSVFNWSGLQVNANYNNGVEEDVTGDCTITPASGTTASTPGEQEVTVTYVDSSQIEYEESFSVVVTDFANCFVINDYFTSDSNIHRFDADSDDVIANVPSINVFLATENDIWYKDSSGIQTIINGSIKKILGNVSYSTFACDDGCATVGSPYQNTDGKYQFDCAFAKGNLADGITETKALFSVVRSETIRPTYKNPGNTAYRHYKHFIPLLLDVYNSSTHRTTVEYGYYDLDREELVDGWKTSMVSSSLNGYWRTTHIFTDDAEYFYINYANVRYMHVYKDGEHQWFDISSISSLGTGGTDVVPKLYYDKTNSCLVLFLMTYAPATECIKLNLDGHTVIGNVSLPQYLDVAFEDSDPYDHARVWINTSASSASGQFDIYAYSVLGDAHWFWWFDENGEVASPQNILGSYSNPSSLTDHFAINIDNLYLQSSSGNFARRYTT